MTAMFPPVEGLRVLDTGCGPDWYSQYLHERGAIVTAIDATASMVAATQARLAKSADVRQADLNHRLDFMPDASVDMVVCSMVLHYVTDVRGPLGEFARILRPHGNLFVSIPHPLADYLDLQPQRYLAQQRFMLERSIGHVPQYFRPLSTFTEALAEAEFVIQRLVEPIPTPEFERVMPDAYAQLLRVPSFLMIHARRA